MKYTQAINIIRKCQFDIIDLMASNLIKSKVLKYKNTIGDGGSTAL